MVSKKRKLEPVLQEIRDAAARLDALLPRGSARELSERSGVDEGQISRIRSAKQLRFSANVAVRLANALGVRVGWLLTGEEPQYPVRAVTERALTEAEVDRIAAAVAARVQQTVVPAGDEGPPPSDRVLKR